MNGCKRVASWSMVAPLLLLTCGISALRAADSVEAQAQQALIKLPGDTGFLFTELTADGPKPLYGLKQNDRFAVGSTFKLFILGTLAAEVNADRRELDNIMRLRSDLAGPPHSELAGWPAGSPVTLHTLALKMISISDNTATDHLFYLLGRESIEAQMRVMGDEHAEWNRPLLNTREMALLRDKRGGMPGREYQKLDEAGKRQFLAERFRGLTNYDKVEFDTAAYDLAEWYATPLDMAHALAWLKNNTREGQPAHSLLAILAIDPKLPHDAKVWPYVGFKGGSEDQLLAGNWLLRHQNGNWYTLHAYYNNPAGPADKGQMLEAVAKIFATIQASLEVKQP